MNKQTSVIFSSQKVIGAKEENGTGKRMEGGKAGLLQF